MFTAAFLGPAVYRENLAASLATAQALFSFAQPKRLNHRVRTSSDSSCLVVRDNMPERFEWQYRGTENWIFTLTAKHSPALPSLASKKSCSTWRRAAEFHARRCMGWPRTNPIP